MALLSTVIAGTHSTVLLLEELAVASQLICSDQSTVLQML
jgi:hypothetical protein